ncbi:hypothetical protein GUJ93_ZPchr0013g37132 [Zizania palustris]|uniref:Uncharacterized protein n=1 Tax=Zizania palustris TaxID=103762 RepID=A0A8J6C3G1_ZIZPA|nr:hypothetical protein GUJ93_ZPchr0013g37132 [Zizania palustris]
MDGEGRSWTFPVYILNNEFVDRFPLDDDDLPPNGGNPHPFNGDIFPGEPEWVQQWVDEQMIQGASPTEADLEVEHQIVNILNELVVEDDARDD